MSRIILVLFIIILAISCLFFLLSDILALPVIAVLLSKVGIIIGVGGIFSLWVLQKFVGKKGSDILVVNFIILGTTLVFLAMAGEFVVRFLMRDISTTADNTSYFAMRWKKQHVHLNNRGYREREFSLSKPDGTYRIAVIGDSITFGQGLLEEKRFSNLLEQTLNKEKHVFEILNLGRPGAETIDHIAILKDPVLMANADFVLLQWFINDVEGQVEEERPQILPLLPFATAHSILHRYSALYYLLQQTWQSFQIGIRLQESYAEYMYRLFGDPKSRESRKSAQALREFIEICKKSNLPVGIVLFPMVGPDLGKEYPFAFLHDRVLDQCKEEGIICFDLRPVLSPYAVGKENKKLWVNRLDPHPGPLINRLAAEKILEQFAPLWLASIGK